MLVFDWDGEGASAMRSLEINDETLRDGLQAASVLDPPLDDKRELLDLMARVGVRAASLGMPAAGPRALEEVVALARHLRDARLDLEPNCGARTLVKDIVPLVEAVQRSGQRIVVHAFIGSSPIRMWAEDWDAALVRERAVEAIDFEPVPTESGLTRVPRDTVPTTGDVHFGETNPYTGGLVRHTKEVIRSIIP